MTESIFDVSKISREQHSKENIYLLQELKVRGGAIRADKLNQSIIEPPYVPDIRKVQNLVRLR
jgi:hypothetical protein